MFWNKKKQNDQSNDSSTLYGEITQAVVVDMMTMHVISSPQLKFFHDDKGILEGLVKEHVTNPEFLALKCEADFDYMFLCGMHAFGAGIYITLYQAQINKSIQEFGQTELREIAVAFSQVDAYELALAVLGLDLNSNNKKVFDHIIITAIQTAANNAGKNATHPNTIKQLMQVLFNAGISVAMR
jgi:hypothetical protein